MQNIESPQVEGQVSVQRKIFGSKARMAAGVLAFGVVAFASGGALFSEGSALARSELMRSVAATTPLVPNSPRLLSGNQQFSFADLVERVSPAVVSVQVDVERGMQPSATPDIPAPFREFFRRFDGPNGRNFRAPQTFRSQASGSGFIVDNAGYIVTNNHVVESARRITVKLSDRREFEAKLVGSDKDTDVALLKVEATNLPTVALGDDRRLRVGDWVIAVGNPFNLGGTVTAGIVSSIGRDIGNGPYTDYIQIDAPINRGNSGGPTFDISGRVVGMNTAIFSPSGGSVGIGFAVPATRSRTSSINSRRPAGQSRLAWRADPGFHPGAYLKHEPERCQRSDRRRGCRRQPGPTRRVRPRRRRHRGQRHRRCGLQGFDPPGGSAESRPKCELHGVRDGARQTLTATIERRDPERLASSDQAPSAQPSSLGMSLMPINPAVRQQYELSNDMRGVLVASVDPDGEAARKGLREGDVIKRVGSNPVQLPSDVTRGIDEARRMGRETVAVLVANNDGERFVALRIAQG